MTDKVQLIKQEIERLFDEYPMSRGMRMILLNNLKTICKMSNYFTTLGNDGQKYCFCISHKDDGDYIEVHKMDRHRMSTFNDKTFVTRIPLARILKIISKE